MLDLDFFKKINDKYGHQTGDKVLIELSSFLKQNTRAFDVVGRYGGDEFVILFSLQKNKDKTLRQTVKELSNRLKKTIEEATFTDRKLNITASLGVIIFDGNTTSTPSELIEQADKLLYLAKARGRNTVCLEVLKERKVA